MILIDFFGFPGCGKSTIAKKIYEDFRKKNIDIMLFNNNEYVDEKVHSNIILKYIRILLPKNLLFMWNIIIKGPKLNKERIILKQSLKERIWKKLRLVILYDSFVNKKMDKIILVDQGIIQDFVDYILYRNASDEYIMKYLNYFESENNKIIFVDCNIEKDTAIERIKKRNRNMFSFDKLSEEKLNEILDLQKNKLDKVISLINNKIISIYMSKDLLEENAKNIERELEK